MNFFSKSRNNSPPPPPHQLLHQAFSSLQTNLSNFFHNPINPFFSPSPHPPPFAQISTTINPPNNLTTNNNNSLKNQSLSIDDIEERLSGIPVFALSNNSQEFALISGSNTDMSLGLFCFGEDDVKSLIYHMESMGPFMRNGSKVVPVSLNTINSRAFSSLILDFVKN